MGGLPSTQIARIFAAFFWYLGAIYNAIAYQDWKMARRAAITSAWVPTHVPRPRAVVRRPTDGAARPPPNAQSRKYAAILAPARPAPMRPTTLSQKRYYRAHANGGKRTKSWKSNPTPRCSGGTNKLFRRPAELTQRPLSVTRPICGLSSPAMTRSRLDFPQPDGPSKTDKFPCRQVKRDIVQSGTHPVMLGENFLAEPSFAINKGNPVDLQNWRHRVIHSDETVFLAK